jgi:hypothetical protein
MRKFMIAAAIAIGALSAAPASSIAAPAASQNSLAVPSGVDSVQYYRDRGYRRDWRPVRRQWDRPGHHYGRRYGGPPPHARAYGRRGHERGYSRF